MSIPTSVPSEILNHPQFQEFLRIMPVAPNLLYMEFLTQAEGSPARLKNLLDSYSQSMAKVPKIGQGQGIKRYISLDHGVSLDLTYVPINNIPQYLVEVRVQPSDHKLLDGPGPVHGRLSGEEALEAVNKVYYLAINQGFRVQTRTRTTPYFAIPEPPNH